MSYAVDGYRWLVINTDNFNPEKEGYLYYAVTAVPRETRRFE